MNCGAEHNYVSCNDRRDTIPKSIRLDVAELNGKQTIRICNLPLPDGVRVVATGEVRVLSCFCSRMGG